MSDLQAARAELEHAERIVAMLDVDDEATGIAAARWVIERDLAARRVGAWRALVARLVAAGPCRCAGAPHRVDNCPEAGR